MTALVQALNHIVVRTNEAMEPYGARLNGEELKPGTMGAEWLKPDSYLPAIDYDKSCLIGISDASKTAAGEGYLAP